MFSKWTKNDLKFVAIQILAKFDEEFTRTQSEASLSRLKILLWSMKSHKNVIIREGSRHAEAGKHNMKKKKNYWKTSE